MAFFSDQQVYAITDQHSTNVIFKHRDLERRYKMLELNAVGVQRKLTAEKDYRERCENDLERTRNDLEVMQQSLQRAEQQLHVEIDRCDDLEKEKTQLLNRTETEKVGFLFWQ